MKPEKTCDKSMNFQECELAILRLAVDKAEEKMGKRVVQSDDIKKIRVLKEVVEINRRVLQEEKQSLKKGPGLFGYDSEDE